MTTEIELEKDAIKASDDLEKTPEFQAWVKAKTQECLRYLELSFTLKLQPEKLLFYPDYLGYPDPVGQLHSHARIWGYNYKINEEIAINPATGQRMTYVVWQVLDQPVVVANPVLESDEGIGTEFDAEPVEAE